MSQVGKGHAVREGLAAVTGGIILIQDADLEYSVDDYGKLIDRSCAARPTSPSGAATSPASQCG